MIVKLQKICELLLDLWYLDSYRDTSNKYPHPLPIFNSRFSSDDSAVLIIFVHWITLLSRENSDSRLVVSILIFEVILHSNTSSNV